MKNTTQYSKQKQQRMDVSKPEFSWIWFNEQGR